MTNKKHKKKMKKKINLKGRVPHQLNENFYPTAEQIQENERRHKK